MRRWLAAVALGGAVGLMLTGCGLPAGVDGDLVNNWAPVAAPKAFTPPAQVCHAADFADTGYLSSFNPVDCATSHRVETVHVGMFTGAAADRTSPPPKGSPELRAAYAECDAKTTQYVGNEWRTARLWLGVALPSPLAWSGGSRWFRCDVTEVDNVEDRGDTTSRTGSLRDALKSPSPLSLGCYAVKLSKNDGIDTMPSTPCTKVHNSEFVGVWTAPNVPFPTKSADWDRLHSACRKVIAKYVGVPADGNIKYRTGVVSLPGPRDEWQSGNRGVRCYLWLSEKKLTRSLKGTGNGGLPIQYR